MNKNTTTDSHTRACPGCGKQMPALARSHDCGWQKQAKRAPFRTTYILFGLLAILLVAFGLIITFNKPVTAPSPFVFPAFHDPKEKLKVEDVDTFEIHRLKPKEEKLVFQRIGRDHWKQVEPVQGLADRHVVNHALHQVVFAEVEEQGEQASKKDFAERGLNEPAAVVTLTRKEGGQKWELKLGNDSLTGNEQNKLVYVASSERPDEVLNVRKARVNMLFKPAADFRKRDNLLLDHMDYLTAAQEVRFQLAGQPEVILKKKDPLTRDWVFVKPNLGNAEYTGGVEKLLTILTNLKMASSADFVADHVKDLAEYGLEDDKPATLQIGTRYRAEPEDKELQTEGLLIGKKAPAKAEKKDEEKYFARMAKERNVFLIPVKSIEPIIKLCENNALALRSRQLLTLDQNQIDAFDLKQADGTLLQFRRIGTPAVWRLWDGQVAGVLADKGTINLLLGSLAFNGQIRKFVDKPDSELGLEDKDPRIILSIWTSSLPRPKADEKKKDDKTPPAETIATPIPTPKGNPAVVFTFGKKELDALYVRREIGNQIIRAAIPAIVLPLLKEPRVHYLPRVLPTFDTTAAIGIKLERPAGTIALTKDTAGWRVQAPKALVGLTVDEVKVENILSALHELRAKKLIADQPGFFELIGWQLAPPQFSATITVLGKDLKPVDHVYRFGREAEKGGFIYAQQGERPLVFLVDPINVLGTVKNADPISRQVFSYVPNKITRVKLQGRLPKAKKPWELELERGIDTWTTKVKDFPLDPNKAHNIASLLADLKAERYISASSGPKPEHGLDAKDRTLQVELTVQDNKDPITLTVGKQLPNKKGWYASASTRPKAIFVLPADGFQTLIDSGADFFKKK